MSAEDSLIAALHGDKKAVLKEQAKMIEDEIKTREKIEKDTVQKVEQEIVDVDNEILKLKPDHVHTVQSSELRKELQELEKEKMELTKEEREESRDCWKDVQELKKEERVVEKELTEIEKRKQRLEELHD